MCEPHLGEFGHNGRLQFLSEPSFLEGTDIVIVEFSLFDNAFSRYNEPQPVFIYGLNPLSQTVLHL
jgi:hypothetical protein